MGSYGSLLIGKTELYSSKNAVNQYLITLFDDGERLVAQSKVIGTDDEGNSVLIETNEVYYITLLSIVKSRLEVQGFTYRTLISSFDESISLVLLDKKRYNETASFFANFSSVSDEIEVLTNLSFDKWISCIHQIMQNSYESVHDILNSEENYSTLKYIISNRFDEFFGFPIYDTRLFVRALTELDRFGVAYTIKYDLSDLVNGGWIEVGDDFVEENVLDFLKEFRENYKTIVLTEGTTDSEVISKSMKLLYPHLHRLYSFIDFKEYKVAGGVGQIEGLAKAFMSLGIANRVIVILDNDTAAQEVLQRLRGLDVPENFRISSYPDTTCMENYPTLGPQGDISMNINGMAGSIELYFGEDVLKINSVFVPIQWTGFNSSLRRYQGEILQKNDLKRRFMSRFTEIEAGRKVHEDFDWTDMSAILRHIFNIFNV